MPDKVIVVTKETTRTITPKSSPSTGSLNGPIIGNYQPTQSSPSRGSSRSTPFENFVMAVFLIVLVLFVIGCFVTGEYWNLLWFPVVYVVLFIFATAAIWLNDGKH